MKTVLLVGIIAVTLVLIVAVARSAKRRRDDRLRAKAEEHRSQARDTELEARKLAANAEERAARAKRETALAEQQRIEAGRVQDDAEVLHTKADKLDPDMVSR
jgi:FtsZ-interacting cell division protein ZipA